MTSSTQGRGPAGARRPPRLRVRAFTLALVTATCVELAHLTPSLASFVNLTSAGPSALVAAKLATPVGLATANGGCAGGSTQTNVAATWTASAERDANGQPLIDGYTLLRSTSSAGSYSSVGTTGIATSFTNVNPSGAEAPQVYVGNNGELVKTVHAINSSTNVGTSITTGIIGTEPNGMAVTPDGTKIVVAEGTSHQVQIITVATHAVAATVTLPEIVGVKSRPDAVAITPNGLTAYIVDGANKRVYPMTISSGALGAAIVVGTQGDPGAIIVTPNGERVYVANYGAHNVSVIATASNTVTATITIGTFETGKPIALAVTPNSAHVYVADQGNSKINDIATASNTVTATITVGSMADANVAAGGDPNILAITPDGSKLYVASFTGHGVADIATATDKVTSTIVLFESGTATPNALALTPNGCQLYVHDRAHNLVDAVTVSSDTVSAHPAVGTTGDPTGMSATPDSSKVYVANQAASSVSVIATATNTVSATLTEATVGKAPYAVLATPSQYFYKLQAGHGVWRSSLTSSVAYQLGWNQGGWQ
jgi:YVTN family beta-propeller protein